jgi:hypothetical protein
MNTTYPDFVQEIADKLKLMESLDSSYHIGPAKDYVLTDAHRAAGIESHKDYELDGGNAGVMSIYRRHGAYEIHHHVVDLDNPDKTISGHMIGNGKPNPKFISTMYKVGKRIIDSGNSLRVVGNHTTIRENMPKITRKLPFLILEPRQELWRVSSV